MKVNGVTFDLHFTKKEDHNILNPKKNNLEYIREQLVQDVLSVITENI